MKVLISAGESSGDQYAARLVEELKKRFRGAEFFGCAGSSMRAAGVRPVIEAERLAIVGLVEIVAHLPRIRRDFMALWRAARAERPDLAILTDSPDFHLRLAKKLYRLGIPVVYLIAPQAWAWRRWRVRLMRRVIRRLLCIFPFEEPFFRAHGVPATYIGHPLAGAVRPSLGKTEFFRKHRLAAERPLIAVLPGSRRGEAARHLPLMAATVRKLNSWRAMNFVLAASTTTGRGFFLPRLSGSEIKVVESETWDVLAHADLALVASGTATLEAALLGTPMVTFYKVHPVSWMLGRWMVSAPFLSMVNLLAGRAVVPELIQSQCTEDRLAEEARLLLEDGARRDRMRRELQEIQARLAGGERAIERAADAVAEVLCTSRTVAACPTGSL